MAINTIEFDKDINLIDFKIYSAHLVIIAPRWVLTAKSIKIEIEGRAGAPPDKKPSPASTIPQAKIGVDGIRGNNGIDGHEGNCGEPGP